MILRVWSTSSKNDFLNDVGQDVALKWGQLSPIYSFPIFLSFRSTGEVFPLTTEGHIEVGIFLMNTKLNFNGFLNFAHVLFGKNTRTVKKS